MQQTLSQLLTSFLTVVGVLVMMFLISPLLALIAIVTVPLSLSSPWRSKRSQGALSPVAHTARSTLKIEEEFTGHSLVKLFGRQREVEAEFRKTQRRALPGRA